APRQHSASRPGGGIPDSSGWVDRTAHRTRQARYGTFHRLLVGYSGRRGRGQFRSGRAGLVSRLTMAETDSVTIEEDEPVLLIGVNRPDAHNLWNLEVIQTVSRAYRRLADTDHLRVGVIFGHGRTFTAGLDLASVGPLIATGDVRAVLPEDGYDPWNF